MMITENVKTALLVASAAVVGVLSIAALGYAAQHGFDITFENVEPTTFNTVSAFLSVVSTVGFGFSISLTYNYFLSWSMRRGSDLPVSVLGAVPANAVSSFLVARALKYAIPLSMLTALFVFADFAHTFGDIGLDFISIPVAGPKDTVLNLGNRNSARLIETAGDPIGQTRPLFVQLFDSEGYQNVTNLPYARELNSMIDGFLLATDLIARSGSPFISEGKTVRWNVFEEEGARFDFLNDKSYPFHNYYYGENNTFISEISLEIPLSCGSPEMVKVEQMVLSTCETKPNDFKSTALVPNCTFSAERSTGIFGEQPKTASILETADRPIFNGTVFLKNGTDEFISFNATPDMRQLARDRNDWKSGRTAPGITGLRIGTHLDIDFGNVVLAGGNQETNVGFVIGPTNATGQADITLISQAETDYLLVAEIVRTCPPRPSGFPVTDTTCYATVEIKCPTFPEDSGFTYQCFGPDIDDLFAGRGACYAFSLAIHWGKGFQFDAKLAAVIAGMYGRVKPQSPDIAFSRMASLSGLFVTASLDIRTSTTELVRPNINSIFIAMRLIPFFLITILLLVAAYFSRFHPDIELPIPRDAWHLLKMGSKEHQVIADAERKNTDPSSAMVLISPDDNKALKLSINKSSGLVSQPAGPIDSGEDKSQASC